MQPSKEKLLIIGTGSFAEEVADLAEETGNYEVAGFIENSNQDRVGQKLLGCPILWIQETASLARSHKAVCAMGTTQRSRFIGQMAAFGFQFATVVHPMVRVSSKSSVGEGSIINAGSVIATCVKVGRHVILNRGCLVGHHTKIHDYATISPGSNIAANVTIGEATFIGIGAIVVNNLAIGAHSYVGAGSVVTRSIPDRVQVLGSPARVFKRNIEEK